MIKKACPPAITFVVYELQQAVVSSRQLSQLRSNVLYSFLSRMARNRFPVVRSCVRSFVHPLTYATTLASTRMFRSVSLNLYRYFLETWYTYKASADKYCNSTYKFYRIMPLCKFQYANHVRSITLKPFKIFS